MFGQESIAEVGELPDVPTGPGADASDPPVEVHQQAEGSEPGQGAVRGAGDDRVRLGQAKVLARQLPGSEKPERSDRRQNLPVALT
jgi:hypothetical protein